ncbi:MAG TPA: VOC family protein [Candidatus Limnocylindrales bacterium]|nr:VOC family protein [Candidatus Limnocylindrales bacterium]
MTDLRMDNVGIVVDDMQAAIDFFVEIGLELEGQGTFEGPWMDRTIGLEGARCEIAMLRPPDGHGGVELSKFMSPPVADTKPANAAVNALGYLRVMFAVDDIDDVVARLRERHGATLVGEVATYENVYRLCYVRSREGFMVGLAQQLGEGG